MLNNLNLEKHSTELSNAFLVSKTTNLKVHKEVTFGLFIDLSKAFDIIHCEILLFKIFNFGTTGLPFNWLKSNVFNQSQAQTSF